MASSSARAVAAPVGVVDGGLQLVDPMLVLDASSVVDDGINRPVLAVKIAGLRCQAGLDEARVAGLGAEVEDVELVAWCGQQAGQVAHSLGVAQGCDVAVIGDVLDVVAGEPSEVIGDDVAVGGGDLSLGVVTDASGRVDHIGDDKRREATFRSGCRPGPDQELLDLGQYALGVADEG